MKSARSEIPDPGGIVIVGIRKPSTPCGRSCSRSSRNNHRQAPYRSRASANVSLEIVGQRGKHVAGSPAARSSFGDRRRIVFAATVKLRPSDRYTSSILSFSTIQPAAGLFSAFRRFLRGDQHGNMMGLGMEGKPAREGRSRHRRCRASASPSRALRLEDERIAITPSGMIGSCRIGIRRAPSLCSNSL